IFIFSVPTGSISQKFILICFIYQRTVSFKSPGMALEIGKGTFSATSTMPSLLISLIAASNSEDFCKRTLNHLFKYGLVGKQCWTSLIPYFANTSFRVFTSSEGVEL